MAEQQKFVAFDGMSFPLDGEVVTIDCDAGPLRGAGLTWAVHDGRLRATMEFSVRGMDDPLRVSVMETDDGKIHMIFPDVPLATSWVD